MYVTWGLLPPSPGTGAAPCPISAPGCAMDIIGVLLSLTVTYSSVRGIRGISRFCTVQSSQTVHISITYFFYSVHHAFFPFQLPISPLELQSACTSLLPCPEIFSLLDVGTWLSKTQHSCSALFLLSEN